MFDLTTVMTIAVLAFVLGYLTCAFVSAAWGCWFRWRERRRSARR